MSSAYVVYVLANADEMFYIGLTDDVQQRLEQHNSGLSKWTKGKGPWRVVWESESMPLGAARKLENRLKRQGRGAGFYSITGLPQRKGTS